MLLQCFNNLSSFLRSSQSPKGNILSFLLTFLLRCLLYIQYLVHKISIWLNVLTDVYAHEPITTIKTMNTRVIPEISLFVISSFCPYLDSQLHILNSGSPLTDTPVLSFLKHWPRNFPRQKYENTLEISLFVLHFLGIIVLHCLMPSILKIIFSLILSVLLLLLLHMGT